MDENDGLALEGCVDTNNAIEIGLASPWLDLGRSSSCDSRFSSFPFSPYCSSVILLRLFLHASPPATVI